MSLVIIVTLPLFLHIALAVLIHIIHLRGRHTYRLRNKFIFLAYVPIEYESFLNRFIWLINGTFTDTTTSGQRGPGSNDGSPLPRITRTGAAVQCHTQDTLFWGRGSYPSTGNTVTVIYAPPIGWWIRWTTVYMYIVILGNQSFTVRK